MKAKKDIALVLAKIRGFEKTQTAIRNDCPIHCASTPDEPPISIGEIAAGRACASVSLAILMLTGYAAYHWIGHESQRVFDDLVWHEPLHDWNR